MGGFYSLQVEEDLTEVTPSKMLHNKRLLTLDPRSPSKFIDRTPIVVDRTPDPQSDRFRMSQSATETPVIKDPRSPTTEFTRTPINPCLSPVLTKKVQTSTVCAESANDSFSVPDVDLDHDLSDVSSESVPELEQADVSAKSPETVVSSENACVLPEESADFNDKGLPGSDGLRSVPSHDDGAKGYSKEHENTKSVIMKPPSVIAVSRDDDSTPKLAALSRSLHHKGIGMKPKQLSIKPGVTRSPLSAVENSPRLAWQRSNKLPHGRELGEVSGRFVDKENVLH